MPHRPLIVAGLDPASDQLAIRFEERLTGRSSHVPVRVLSQLWVPGRLQDFIRELDRFRKETAEKEFAGEPILCLWTAAWHRDGPKGLELAFPLIDFLQRWSPSPGLRLSIFFPRMGLISSDQAMRVEHVFSKAEQLVDQCAFLDLLLLHQVDLIEQPPAEAIQQEPEQGSSDQTAQPSIPPLIMDPDAELPEEILFRELCHPEVSLQIRQLALPATEHKASFHGRPACFTAIGFHELVHPAEAGYRHLTARMQWQTFQDGLRAPVNETFDFRATLQKRASHFVAGQLKEGLTRLSTSLHQAGPVFSLTHSDGWDSRIASFRREIDNWRHGLLDPLQEFDNSLSLAAEGEIAAFLNTATWQQVYFSGTDIYVRALLGESLFMPGEIEQESRRIRNDLRPELVAVEDVLYGFIGANLDEVLPKRFQSDIAPALAQLGVEVKFEPLRSTAAFFQLHEILTNNGGKLNSLDSATGARTRLCADFLKAIAGMACRQACNAEDVLALLPALLEKEVPNLKKEHEDSEEQISEPETAPQSRFGRWARRVFGRTEHREKQSASPQRHTIERTAEDSFSDLFSYVQKLLTEHVLPLYCRMLIAKRVSNAIGKKTKSYRDYVNSVGEYLGQQLESSPLPSVETPHQSSILTPARISHLYDRGKKGMDWPSHAHHMLSFLPPVQQQLGKISYQDCKALGDHFLTGTASLLQRLLDYAMDRFAWLPGLNWLDVITLPTPLDETGEKILERVRQRHLNMVEIKWEEKPGKETYPEDYSLIEIEEPQKAEFVRLFGHVFSGRIQAMVGSDPWTVKFTGVIRGIPRLLIRGLP